jgi:plasmid stabilization system protein ParE
VKLRYTRRAAAELDEILDFIDQRSPQGANHVKGRLRAVIDLLLQRVGWVEPLPIAEKRC